MGITNISVRLLLDEGARLRFHGTAVALGR